MIDPGTKIAWACPLNGKDCIDGVREDFSDIKTESGAIVGKRKCRWWQHIQGKDPQSDKFIDQWDCAIAWMPTIGLEGAQQSRQCGASVDKVANHVSEVKSNISALAGAVRVAAQQLSQAVEAGALTVMLPSPATDPESNGHETRELKEGEKPNEN